MQLSVIIVNYNVKHFLEQCLFSVTKAINEKLIPGEIIVVDNNSNDGSIDYLMPQFPSVTFILNKENLGFAKACNQGMKKANGKYILFLNPDTLLPEDCLEKCISFLEANPNAGSLGIKMLDGKGKFLKESKRAFPSPMTSFFKLSGLTKLFPRTRPFANYYLGHLDENKNHEVDVLAGAFMMIRKEALEKTGGFDEIFFMYGEDIDLSYRIQKAGYKNYYFADSSIIHFKGESTKKNSLNYVRLFYKAMSIFVQKHYGGNRAGIYNLLIQMAIGVSAVFSAFAKFIRKIGLPIIDAGLILVSFWVIKNIWNVYVKGDTVYESSLLWIALPLYTLVYLIVAYYAGLYDRGYRKTSLLRSTMIATLVLLAGYAMLPEKFRFSRGIIFFGAILSFFLIGIQRWLLIRLHVLFETENNNEELNTLVVGSKAEFEKLTSLLKEAGYTEKVLGRLAVDKNDTEGIGYWKEMKSLFQSIPVKEVIFCEGTLSFKEILDSIINDSLNCKIKFHAAGSKSIVGSDSKNYSGESVSNENGYKLSDPYYKRIKRLVDISTAVFFLLTFPVHFFFVKKPVSFIVNCLQVLVAKKTWVGYALNTGYLPAIRPAVLTEVLNHSTAMQKFSEQSLQIADQLYAKEYSAWKDLKLIFGSYKKLGA